MADLTTSRRALLGALAIAAPAAAAPVGLSCTPAADRALWDQRVNRLRLLQALVKAGDAFGPNYYAGETFQMGKWKIESEFGSWNKAWRDSNGRKQCEALNAADNASSDVTYRAYYLPSLTAALLLLRTPAPDTEAVLTKIAVVEEFELYCDTTLGEGEAFNIVAADIARLLAGGQA